VNRFAAITIAFATLLSTAADAQDRPNILLILADDLGYTDLGTFGGEIPTPTLDALAMDGVRLTSFHTGRACQQTRSMLMSGRGFMSAIEMRPLRADGERANALRADIATMPELLRGAGYSTYMAGKWDLGLTPDRTPAARGFDRSFTLLEASASHFAEDFWGEESWYQEDGNRLAMQDLPADFYSTIGYTDKILEYLGDHATGTPWFGYLTYTAPHWPLQVPDEWRDRHAGNYDAGYDELRAERVRRADAAGVLPDGFSMSSFERVSVPWSELDPGLQRRYARSQEIYASMVELLDQQIGRIVEFLDDTGQLDNTFILFMSDHGASAAEIGIRPGPTTMPSHFEAVVDRSDNSLDNMGRPGSFVDHGTGFAEAATAPFRYFKGTVTEGGIRAAAFVRYPPAIAAGEIRDTFITVMDLLPTVLEIAGASHPGDADFNGRRVQRAVGTSFWPSLTGTGEAVHPNDAVGWAAGGIGAIVHGQYKLTNQPWPREAPGRNDPTWQLYDLARDPGETTDIAQANPDIVNELLRAWLQNWQ